MRLRPSFLPHKTFTKPVLKHYKFSIVPCLFTTGLIFSCFCWLDYTQLSIKGQNPHREPLNINAREIHRKLCINILDMIQIVINLTAHMEFI